MQKDYKAMFHRYMKMLVMQITRLSIRIKDRAKTTDFKGMTLRAWATVRAHTNVLLIRTKPHRSAAWAFITKAVAKARSQFLLLISKWPRSAVKPSPEPATTPLPQATSRRLYMLRRGAALAVVLLLLFFIPVLAYNSNLQPAGPGSPTIVTVPPGCTASSIAVLLEQEKLIRSGKAFTWAVRLNKLGSQIKAGTYDLPPEMSTMDILDKLVRGEVVNMNVRVTIPEGLTIPLVGELFEKIGFFTKESFILAAESVELPYEYLKAVPDNVDRKLEGYLFPDTYEFSPHVTPQQVIRTMAARFHELVPPRYEQSELRHTYSLHQVVTMASIVEKEAVRHDERARIAGVFYNRLDIREPLGSCATIQYILGTPRALLYADLEIPSVYNTYRNVGLTPGPIANAGLASFEAALLPESHDLLFFVARPDGSHVFTRTNAEHERAIRQISSGK